ncbi:DUF2938 domain-containing protein [Pontimicrobium aquaticum]|uniref:DUF2938 domain-containing protein n=1 Tax=Pontimicrobium aquaticum TaxID=2565367 RepID=A0A4V5LQS4_9FLAO|nr:DUF2938 domain-containing protein [Pontimicrobium aquaticum]TJY35949.1 DUF2938 domain-containing protein [Pontimicrobium aquaticum]
MKTINWKYAIIAGIIGTVFFDIAGLFFTGKWWDIPSILGEKTGLGLVYGVLVHYSNGVFLAILFAGIAPSLWGPKWLRPIVFMICQTIVVVWLFMFPLLGAGIAGTKLSPMMPLITIFRHLAFAVPLIFLIHASIPQVKTIKVK